MKMKNQFAKLTKNQDKSSKAVEQQQKCSNTAGNRQILEVISSLDGLEWAGMGWDGRRPGGMRGAGLYTA